MSRKYLLFPMLIILLATGCAGGSQKRSFGETIDDEVIALNLRTKYIKDKGVPAKDIKVGVWRGTVTLKGEMKEQDHINRAIEIAEQLKGVKEVKAFLVLKEFGEMRERRAQVSEPFYKKIFQPSGARIGKNNKDKLKERNLSDDSSGDATDTDEMVARETPAPRKPVPQQTESDDLDAEEEF